MSGPEEFADRGHGPFEQLQQRLLDHGQTHLGRDRLALRIGCGDGHLHWLSGFHRTLRAVFPLVRQRYLQIAHHGERARGFVETERRRGLGLTVFAACVARF